PRPVCRVLRRRARAHVLLRRRHAAGGVRGVAGARSGARRRARHARRDRRQAPVHDSRARRLPRDPRHRRPRHDRARPHARRRPAVARRRRAAERAAGDGALDPRHRAREAREPDAALRDLHRRGAARSRNLPGGARVVAFDERDLPNPLPRPEGELAELERVWATPKGWRIVTAVNNTVIGIFYIGTAFFLFLVAGLLALLMRTQLAVPENDFIGQPLYNQMFTVHGTTMTFLFAVPAVEALGVMLLPQMLAARDLPFPRLSAFAIWAYVIGGLVFVSTILYDLAPAGGWFMYPPLTLKEFSPGDNADFWLLGIGFIEISAIAGAIEIVVGTLKTRPPGMSLMRMPIFGWAMLIFAAMIMFAFPAVILATMMLEIERSFGWPFFTAAQGGDPLLWQHLFWFFGHPEVYIIFVPAAGLVSMIVTAMAQRPLIGYRFIVVALIATGFISFGLWVHHMFTPGIPSLSLAFLSTASMAVAVPSVIQVFSWLATMAASRGRFRITTPSLFVLGLLVI